MRALITGANGHVGSHIVREVLQAGWTPIGFVREGADLRAVSALEPAVAAKVRARLGERARPDPDWT